MDSRKIPQQPMCLHTDVAGETSLDCPSLAILHIFRVRLRLRPMSKAKAVAMRLRLRIPPEAKDAAKALKALALRLRFRIPPKAKDAVCNGYTIDLHFEGSSARFKPQHLKSGFIPRP